MIENSSLKVLSTCKEVCFFLISNMFGGFHGDGPIKFSYDNPGRNQDKITFNLIFKEVRAGIETAFALGFLF